jgi:phosphate transport system substrate-binding protein
MKTMTNKCALLAIVAGALTLSARAEVTVKGSDTMVILAQKWAEVYMGKNPGQKVQVTGGGSGTGIAALQNQTTDLCNSSRKMKAAELANCIRLFKRRPTEYKVALDGVTVYVHDDNPVKELSLDDLERIFTGRAKNWKEFGGPDARITVYSRENSSGTYEFFKEKALRGRDFAASAQTMQGTAAVIQAVSKDKNGIGYGGIGYGKGAKHVPVKRDGSSPPIEPTEENVVGGTYPLWRFLFIYVDPAVDKGDVNAYLNWIRSDEGQQVVKEVGFFALPKTFRAQ